MSMYKCNSKQLLVCHRLRFPCSRKCLCLLYFLLLLAVSNYGSGSHIYFFWQKRSVELIMIGSCPALRGGPSTIFHLYRHSLLCTYCTNSRSLGLKGKDQAKNKRQFSNPWQAECSEGDVSGHEMRSGHCRVLNATAPMCDNFVWLPRACVPGGVGSKTAIRTSLFLSDCPRQRARSTRFHTQRRSGSSFPWQSWPWN